MQKSHKTASNGSSCCDKCCKLWHTGRTEDCFWVIAVIKGTALRWWVKEKKRPSLNIQQSPIFQSASVRNRYSEGEMLKPKHFFFCVRILINIPWLCTWTRHLQHPWIQVEGNRMLAVLLAFTWREDYGNCQIRQTPTALELNPTLTLAEQRILLAVWASLCVG